jgi:GDP-D-mannose dehydratase
MHSLEGMSSVAASFADPGTAWRTSANAVEAMLEAVGRDTLRTRFYQ